jgi:hypothetical protein
MPRKEGLDYFPIDIDMDGDDKVELIEAKHGIVGFGLIVKLLMRIYRNGYYYYWTEKEQLLFSKRVGLPVEKVIAIVGDAAEWEFFDKDMLEGYSILTSKGIQKRYLEASKRRQSVEINSNYLLLGEHCLNDYINVVIVDINPVNVNIEKQRREEKSTVKESRVSTIDIKDVVAAYHDNCPSLPKIIKLSDRRKRLMHARIRDNPNLEAFIQLFIRAETSDFLSGRSGRWTGCNIDWLLNENNMIKVLEGSYDNKASPASKHSQNVENALRLVEKYRQEEAQVT